MNEILEILKIEAQEIESRFRRSSIEGKGTSQEISDFREHAVQDFIRRYYPFPYRISKGGIYDSYGNRSDSIDCLILNPNHPHTVNSMEKHSLLLADGVDVAIEVKPDIASNKELERALIQGISVKKLKQRNGPIVLKQKWPDYIIESSKQIPYCIFSLKAKKNIDDTIKEVKSYYTNNKTPVTEQFDIIVILNKGIIVNYKYKEEFCWNGNEFSDEQKAGWFYEEWGENTLAGLIFHLDRLYGAGANIQEGFLKYYLLSSVRFPMRPV